MVTELESGLLQARHQTLQLVALMGSLMMSEPSSKGTMIQHVIRYSDLTS